MKKLFFTLLLTVVSLYGTVSELKEKDYVSKIEEKSEIVVMFSAPWCGACKEMKPVYGKLATVWGDELAFASVDTEINSAAAVNFRIRSVPTTIVFKEGKEVSRKVGSLDKFQLMLFLRPKGAFDLYAKECTGGDAKACVDLGEAYEEGKVVKKDYAKALAFYSSACEKKSAKGCAYLAYLYDESMGVKEDNKKVLEYYKKGCDGDYAWSCNKLGDIYYYGYNSVKINYSTSFPLFKKACDLGNSSACYSVGFAYHVGDGVKVNHKMAIPFYLKACEDDEMAACTNLGVLYRVGKGVEVDEHRALEFYEKACKSDKEEIVACSSMAWLYISGKQVKHDYKKARVFSKKACNEGDPLGCRLLGYLNSKGLGGEKNIKKAIELYTFACEKKDAQSCKNLSVLK